MIEDARLFPTDVKLDADIAIIGGGAAGISMALNFLNGPLKVVVLESGGTEYESKTQSLYRGRNVGLRYEPLDLCRVRMFGGSTDKRGWAGWCKTFSDLDFEHRDWVGLSGWPISKRDLRPFYKEALKTLSLPTEMEGITEREAHAPDCLPLENGDCVNDPVPLSTAPHLSDAWLETIKASPFVKVILHANVTRIDTDESGQVVTSLQFGTLDRRMFTIEPRFTVVAAGGIETARLMLSSNQTVRTGLGNASDWVGRCFMDHPRYAWGQITSIADPSLLLRYNPTHGVGQRRLGVPLPGAHPLFGFGISPNDAAQRREQILGSRTWIVPVAAQGERDGGRELREVVLWTIMRRRIPSDIVLRSAKILGDIPNAAAAAVAHLRSVAGQMSRWQFLSIIEPEPNPSSRVTLDRDLDPFGQARVKLDWQLTPLVKRTLQVTQNLVVKDLQSIGVECHVEGPGGPAANQKFEEPRWVWHHMGTARMSDDPKMGVVDADCKVHGMRNLFVTGSSVFPTSSTDMPTLTLVALAHRLSTHLRTQLFKTRPADVGSIVPFARATKNVVASSVSGH
jgi:choline dehydrogenase-like flavoprotein